MKSNTIGKLVKELRLDKGYNQSQLAKVVGVSGSCISAIECGKWNPSAKLLGNILIAPKYVQKPVNRKKLVAEVKKAVENQISMPTPAGNFKKIVITFE